MSIATKVLEAAATLSDPFSAEDLVVAAWKLDPASFSLKGYELPDSNKVLATLMGRRGLVKMGALRRLGPKLYSLTKRKPSAARPPRATPEQERAIRAARGSRAVASPNGVSFSEALTVIDAPLEELILSDGEHFDPEPLLKLREALEQRFAKHLKLRRARPSVA